MIDYRECAACAAKPGAPILCAACLHNRRLVGELTSSLRDTSAELERLYGMWSAVLAAEAKDPDHGWKTASVMWKARTLLGKERLPLCPAEPACTCNALTARRLAAAQLIGSPHLADVPKDWPHAADCPAAGR